MEITIDRVKYVAFASVETNCFECRVLIDGEPVGTAHTDGHGGMTFISPRDVEQRIEAYAKTLPVETHDMGNETIYTGGHK